MKSPAVGGAVSPETTGRRRESGVSIKWREATLGSCGNAASFCGI